MESEITIALDDNHRVALRVLGAAKGNHILALGMLETAKVMLAAQLKTMQGESPAAIQPQPASALVGLGN